MAQRVKSELEFIQDTFSPLVAISCSYDAEIICRKNNLTFVELIQPFCRLNEESKIFDPMNTLFNMSNTRIDVKDIQSTLIINPIVTSRLLNESLQYGLQDNELNNNKRHIVNSECLQHLNINLNTSWFESWRDCFLKIGYSIDNEYLKHYLACIFVVSTSHLDPLDQFQKLLAQQQSFSQQPNSYPKCFSLNIYKYFVLLHDANDAEISKAHHVYESLKSTYGAINCHLLQVNSKKSDDKMSQMQFDPWRKYVKFATVANNSASLASNNDNVENTIDEQHPLAMDRLSASEKIEETDSMARNTRGNCLTSSDIDRIKIFISEFINRGLIPWAEKTIKHLYEQTQSKKSILKTFSFQKKLFGVSNSSGSMSSIMRQSPSTQSLDGQESNETQLRKLADLAFLFRFYDLAYNTYHQCKKEFEANTLQLANALEMCSIASFMIIASHQSSKVNVYASQYIDEALILYSTIFKIPFYTTRAIILHTECLRETKQFFKAASKYMTMQEDDTEDMIRSGLFYEQSALCYLAIPMIRKCAFNMSIAGNRFGRCGHKRHAMRVYNQAVEIYSNKKWSKIENNLNFLLSRLYSSLGRVQDALVCIERILFNKNHTMNEQICDVSSEMSMIQDYIKYKSQVNKNTPELLIPFINCQNIKVSVSQDDSETEFSDDSKGDWVNFEEKLCLFDGKSKFLPQRKYFDSQTFNQMSPLACINETIQISFSLKNTLSICIILTKLQLIWKFNDSTEEDAECIVSDSIHEIQMEPKDLIQVNFTIKSINKLGTLNVLGIKYNLSIKNAQEEFLSGKQFFKIKGPRLNNNLAHQRSISYDVDNRLNIRIGPGMPLLRISMDPLAPQLRCGQLESLLITFTNITHFKVKNLKVASNFMSNLCFTRFNFDIMCSKQVNMELDSAINAFDAQDSIYLFKDLIIKENESIQVKLWLRVPNQVGEHKIDFMFYYENFDDMHAQHSKNSLKYRVHRHSIKFDAVPSIELKRSIVHDNSILNFEIENLDTYGVKYELFQISSLSDLWQSKVNFKMSQILSSNEIISLNMNRFALPTSNTRQKLYLSNNFLSNDYNVSLECDPLLKLIDKKDESVIIMWRAFVNNSTIIGLLSFNLIDNKEFKSIKTTIHHASIVRHNFSNTKACILPIKVNLFNSSQEKEFKLLIKVFNHNHKHCNNYLWIGNTSKYFTLNTLTNVNINFKLLLNRDGLFEIGSTREDGIYVYLMNASNEYALIKHLPLFNILIINN